MNGIKGRSNLIALLLSTLVMTSLCLPSYGETRLNNFVVELIRRDHPDRSSNTFVLDRPGWVFIRLENASTDARLVLSYPDGEELIVALASWKPRMDEAMRFLPPGEYTLVLKEGSADRLIVRRVPEIQYIRYRYDPWVHAEGPYDWAFLERAVLPHVNTVVGTVNKDHGREATDWRARGKRWIGEMQAPGFKILAGGMSRGIDTLSPKDILSELVAGSALGRPWMDGLLLDEYGPNHQALFGPTLQAVRRIHQGPNYPGKRVDLYVFGEPEKMSGFLRGAVAAGSKIVMEAYLYEQPTEEAAQRSFRKRLTDKLVRYEKVVPGGRRDLIICLGYMDTPPESLNVDPQVNFRVFQDMEFQHLATDPAWEGVYGVSTYTAGYADRETLEWTARLYRHYCIEGNTTRITDEPYNNDYLTNPDFTDGLTGWDVTEAQEGSVEHRYVEGLGSLQSRYGTEEVGNDCAVMVRSQQGPNQIAQTIRNLVPGREYLLRFFTTSLSRRPGDYENPRYDDLSYVDVGLDGVETVQGSGYDHLFRSIHTPDVMYFTYHVRRFRAAGPAARLTLTDWTSPTAPGGNIGQTTAVNFIEVQRVMDQP
jgi:hypothetical protein